MAKRFADLVRCTFVLLDLVRHEGNGGLFFRAQSDARRPPRSEPTKVYELLRSGELESVRIGSSWRIPAAALNDYVESIRTRELERSENGLETRTVLLRTQRN